MDREGQFVLGNLQLARGFVDQFLQGAERAQPAAEHATAPQQNARGGEDPQHEDQRIGEKQLPAKVLEQRMDEGQDVDHRQLPQGIPAQEHHGEEQVTATQPVQKTGPASELVLQEQDRRQQQQGAREYGDLEVFLVPDGQPHRPVGFLDGRQFFGTGCGSLKVWLGQLISQFETAERATDRTGLTPHQQLQGPGRARIESRRFADNEHRHFIEVGHALGKHVGEPLMVHVTETDDIAELAQLHPIENPATHIARTFIGILPTTQYRDGLLAGFEFLHEDAILMVAQQRAADGRGVQVGGVQLDEGVIDLIRAGVVDTFGFSALEGGIDLSTGQVQPANGAVASQLLPRGGFEKILAYGGGFVHLPALVLDQLERYSHLMGGTHDDLIDHHGGDGGAGDRIDSDRARVAGMPDHHSLVDLDPFVSSTEAVKFFFGDADQQNRFVVLQHIGVLNHAGGVEDHLGIDRLARVGGNIHHIQALEHIPDDLARRRQRAHLERAFGCGNRIGLREGLLDTLLLDVTVGLGLHCRERRDQQQDHHSQPDAPGAPAAMYRRLRDCHEFADFKGACGHIRACCTPCP
ncbi:hypothetical protein D3C84_493560 [compost metagenome]